MREFALLAALIFHAASGRSPCMRHRRHSDGRYFPVADRPNTISVNDALTSAFHSGDQVKLPRTTLLMPRDMQVERMVAQTLDCETFMLRTFVAVFSQVCKYGAGYFIDSGANDGLWSLLAAAFGCPVLAIEPQPACAALVQQGVELNSLAPLVRVINRGLAPDAANLSIPLKGCLGTGSFGELSPPPHRRGQVTVPSTRLDELSELRAEARQLLLNPKPAACVCPPPRSTSGREALAPGRRGGGGARAALRRAALCRAAHTPSDARGTAAPLATFRSGSPVGAQGAAPALPWLAVLHRVQRARVSLGHN